MARAVSVHAVVLAAVLAALGATAGLTPPGVLLGSASGVVTGGLLLRGRASALGVADLVTLGRLTLACALAALAASVVGGTGHIGLLVGLASVSLVLDAVDGRLARATGTTSPFGARFDGEVDAFLLLVLSAYVATTHGAWVLVIGLMRYAFAVAGWVAPRLRGRLPFRYWRKVVTATQGVVLVVAISGVLPRPATYAGLLFALAMLVESFGRDVVWLSRRPLATPAPAAEAGPERRGVTAGASR